MVEYIESCQGSGDALSSVTAAQDEPSSERVAATYNAVITCNSPLLTIMEACKSRPSRLLNLNHSPKEQKAM